MKFINNKSGMAAKDKQSPRRSADGAVIALDLGGTKLAGAIFGAGGDISDKFIEPLAGRSGRKAGKWMADRVAALLQVAEAKGREIVGIGISVPGISYRRTGRVWAPNIPGWGNYPLRREVLSAVGSRRIEVGIESDRACCILGETWRGAAQGCRNCIFLAVGTGIGAGILIDGQVLRGAEDIAGAIGWLALARPYRAEYRQSGCFESHASGEGIAKMVQEYLKKTPAYDGILRAKRIGAISAHDVFAAHRKGDPLAARVLGEAIAFWGMAVANLVSLFNPEKIIFGGGVFGPGLRFLPAIRAEAKKWAQPVSFRQVKFEGSKLGGDAALYGAAYLALRSLRN